MKSTPRLVYQNAGREFQAVEPPGDDPTARYSLASVYGRREIATGLTLEEALNQMAELIQAFRDPRLPDGYFRIYQE